MLIATIALSGVTYDELGMALDEVRKGITRELSSGSECREDNSGSYSFNVAGKESNIWICMKCRADNYEDLDNDECRQCGEERIKLF